MAAERGLAPVGYRLPMLLVVLLGLVAAVGAIAASWLLYLRTL